MAGPLRWWWLRHAPIKGQAGRLAGRGDPEADTSDARALAALARLLPRPAGWVVSPLGRCRQTADALVAHDAGLAPAARLVEPALMEQDFGAWEGRTWDALWASGDPACQAFWEDPAGRAPPGGESFAAMVGRVAAAIARLEGCLVAGDAVVVAHAGTIRAALALALGLAPAAALQFQIDPWSLTRLDRLGKGWRVVAVNLPPAPPAACLLPMPQQTVAQRDPM